MNEIAELLPVLLGIAITIALFAGLGYVLKFLSGSIENETVKELVRETINAIEQAHERAWERLELVVTESDTLLDDELLKLLEELLGRDEALPPDDTTNVAGGA